MDQIRQGDVLLVKRRKPQKFGAKVERAGDDSLVSNMAIILEPQWLL